MGVCAGIGGEPSCQKDRTNPNEEERNPLAARNSHFPPPSFIYTGGMEVSKDKSPNWLLFFPSLPSHHENSKIGKIFVSLSLSEKEFFPTLTLGIIILGFVCGGKRRGRRRCHSHHSVSQESAGKYIGKRGIEMR